MLRFEFDGDTFALVREALKKMQAEHGGTLSEEEALAAVARTALGGPKDEGRASYQIASTLSPLSPPCEACGLATQDGNGEPIAVSEAVAEVACCDGQHIGRVDVPHVTHVGQVGQVERATQTVPPKRRTLVVRRDHGPWRGEDETALREVGALPVGNLCFSLFASLIAIRLMLRSSSSSSEGYGLRADEAWRALEQHPSP